MWFQFKLRTFDIFFTAYHITVSIIFKHFLEVKLKLIVIVWQNDTTYFGAIVGRVANRIGGARFTLNGIQYKTPVNDNGKNSLHGITSTFTLFKLSPLYIQFIKTIFSQYQVVPKDSVMYYGLWEGTTRVVLLHSPTRASMVKWVKILFSFIPTLICASLSYKNALFITQNNQESKIYIFI